MNSERKVAHRKMPVEAEVRMWNLKILMKKRYGDKQVNLARALMRQPDYISRLLNGSKFLSGDMAREFERLLELPKYYLDGNHKDGSEEFVETVSNDRSGKGLVPLIPWEKVGDLTDLKTPYTEDLSFEWLPCPKRDCGRYTFALRVQGIANASPDGKYSYREGDIIFVDPELEGKNESRIITLHPDTNEIVLRQLIIEGRSRYLKALNPAWPEPILKATTEHAYGVVIGKWVDESAE